MGNKPSIPELQKRKRQLENTIISHQIVIRKEHKYGAPDRNRIEELKGDIDIMSEEVERINKALSKK